MTMNQQPAINFDDPDDTRPPMQPPTAHPYKGADGNLYGKESDALKSYGYQNIKAKWMLATSFFDPPHYVFVE